MCVRMRGLLWKKPEVCKVQLNQDKQRSWKLWKEAYRKFGDVDKGGMESKRLGTLSLELTNQSSHEDLMPGPPSLLVLTAHTQVSPRPGKPDSSSWSLMFSSVTWQGWARCSLNSFPCLAFYDSIIGFLKLALWFGREWGDIPVDLNSYLVNSIKIVMVGYSNPPLCALISVDKF